MFHWLSKSGENNIIMSLRSSRVKDHYNWETNQLVLEIKDTLTRDELRQRLFLISPRLLVVVRSFLNTFSLSFLKESLPNVASRLFDRRSSVVMET